MESEEKHFVHLLRVILVCMIVFVQAFLAYSSVGNWFNLTAISSSDSMFMFSNIMVIVAHTFIVAAMFTLTGSFTFNLYSEKGAQYFMRRVVKKYGTAMAVYLILIHPSIFILGHIFRNEQVTFKSIFSDYLPQLSSGPFYFLLAILIFKLGYAVSKRWIRHVNIVSEMRKQMPQLRSAFFVVIVGIFTYFLRIVYPISNYSSLLQIGFLPLYIGMFVSGLLAANNDWVGKLKIDFSIPWVIFSLLCLPILVLSIFYSGEMTEFSGGFTAQSVFVSFWEPMICMAFGFFFAILFFKYFNNKSKKIKYLSDISIGVFLVHPLPIVLLVILLEPIAAPIMVKWLIVSVLSTLVSFLLASLLNRIPMVRQMMDCDVRK